MSQFGTILDIGENTKLTTIQQKLNVFQLKKWRENYSPKFGTGKIKDDSKKNFQTKFVGSAPHEQIQMSVFNNWHQIMIFNCNGLSYLLKVDLVWKKICIRKRQSLWTLFEGFFVHLRRIPFWEDITIIFLSSKWFFLFEFCGFCGRRYHEELKMKETVVVVKALQNTISFCLQSQYKQ